MLILKYYQNLLVFDCSIYQVSKVRSHRNYSTARWTRKETATSCRLTLPPNNTHRGSCRTSWRPVSKPGPSGRCPYTRRCPYPTGRGGSALALWTTPFSGKQNKFEYGTSTVCDATSKKNQTVRTLWRARRECSAGGETWPPCACHVTCARLRCVTRWTYSIHTSKGHVCTRNVGSCERSNNSSGSSSCVACASNDSCDPHIESSPDK